MDTLLLKLCILFKHKNVSKTMTVTAPFISYFTSNQINDNRRHLTISCLRGVSVSVHSADYRHVAILNKQSCVHTSMTQRKFFQDLMQTRLQICLKRVVEWVH